MEYEIKNIPEYKLEDEVVDRLVALVKLEQFIDERSMTVEIVGDLMKIAMMSWFRNEKRIFNIAKLMVRQGLKYVQEEGKVSMRIPSKDFRLLDSLKTSAEKIDASERYSLQKFFKLLSKIYHEDNHFLVKIYINALIKSYNERGNFTGVFSYRKK